MFRNFLIFSVCTLSLVACGGGGGSSQSTLTPPPPPQGNQAPVALATSSMSIAAIGDIVSLSGSESTDPDGDSLSFSWTFTNLPENSTIETRFEGVDLDLVFDVVGEYSLELTVSDGSLSTTQSLEPITTIPFYRQNHENFGFDLIENDFQSDRLLVGSRNFVNIIPNEPLVSSIPIFETPNRTDGLPNIIDSIAIESGGSLGAAYWNEDGGRLGFFDLDTGDLTLTRDFQPSEILAPFPTLAFDGAANFYLFTPNGTGSLTPFVIDPTTGLGDLSEASIPGIPSLFHPDQDRFYIFIDEGSNTTIGEYRFNDGNPIEIASNTILSENICDEMWISSDGTRIYDECGNFISLSDGNDHLNITQNHMDLEGYIPVSIDSNQSTNLIAVGNRDFMCCIEDIIYFDYETGERLGSLNLNDSDVTSGGRFWFTRHVYFTPMRETLRVVAQDDPAFSTTTTTLTIFPMIE